MKRIALAVFLAVAAAGCAGNAATTAPASVTLRDFKIEPSDLTAKAPFTIAVTSNGPTPHNFTVRDAAGSVVVASADLRTGESDTVEVPALAAGDYTFFCSFAGHESLGMHGTLTVAQ